MNLHHVRNGLLGVAMLAAGAGCATNNAEAYMRDRARLAAENNNVWSRPTEVGFDIEPNDIQGQARTTTILWFIHIGAEGGSGFLDTIFGAVKGVPVDDAVTMTAAADAVATTPGADGIYITQRMETGVSFGGLFDTRSVTVKGKPTKLKLLGEVDRERADRDRAIRGLNGTTVIAPAEFLHKLVP